MSGENEDIPMAECGSCRAIVPVDSSSAQCGIHSPASQMSTWRVWRMQYTRTIGFNQMHWVRWYIRSR